MALVRLSRPNVTWALALESAFADPANPTAEELNDERFVHFISCALTEDGTEFTLGDSETDDTLTYCSIGNEQTPVRRVFSASLTWLLDANTGGSGSTVDLTSLYNKVTAMLGRPDIPYWLIKRVGPGNIAQDSAFAVGQKIKMGKFETDVMQFVLENNRKQRGLQNLIPKSDILWNYTISNAS